MDGFFNLDFRGRLLWGRAWNWVWRNGGSWLEAFRGGAKSRPPSRAGFFEEEKFRTAFGTHEASRDDLGVIENEKVFWGKQGRKVANGMVGYFAGRSADEEESGGVPGVGRGGGDPIRRDRQRKEFI
jgi:hypothetical protein